MRLLLLKRNYWTHDVARIVDVVVVQVAWVTSVAVHVEHVRVAAAVSAIRTLINKT